jgi:hypothetical protein
MRAMSSRVVLSLACMVVVTLACNPSVTESTDDDVVDEDSTSDASGEDESSTSESETEASDDALDTIGADDPACTPGTLDCSCDAETCVDGLICVDDVCTMDDATTDSTETGEGKHLCGWDPRNEWYFCGWEGVDPSMEHPISCEEIGFPMVPGSPCEDNLDIVGCCDAQGDAWYCSGGFLEYEVCGAG